MQGIGSKFSTDPNDYPEETSSDIDQVEMTGDEIDNVADMNNQYKYVRPDRASSSTLSEQDVLIIETGVDPGIKNEKNLKYEVDKSIDTQEQSSVIPASTESGDNSFVRENTGDDTTGGNPGSDDASMNPEDLVNE